MSSATIWFRLEPRPRADTLDPDALAEALRARLRDPLWMLTRQWQLGEFLGADSGSPAYVQLTERQTRLASWQRAGGAPVPLAAAPLERQAEAEPATPDLATRVELGQTFEALLRDQGISDLTSDFRQAYAIAPAPQEPADPREAALRRLWAGRAIDGVALYAAARASLPALPAQPASLANPAKPADPGALAARRAAGLAALNAFVLWVDATLGALGTGDPPCWSPERLEYRLEMTAPLPDGRTGVFGVTPDEDGLVDWSACDLQSVAPGDGVPAAATSRSMVPAHVRFRGMPNARFWDFEPAGTDLGSLQPERRDLARLAVMDFMLVHGNDWFMVPVELPLGAIHQIDGLVVFDVFGRGTPIRRADREPISRGEWSLFATSSQVEPGGTADFLVLPPSAGTALQTGPPLEEVRVVRDEMADMAWAIEHLTENALGEPWLGRERDLVRNGAAAPSPPPPQQAGVPLMYRLQSQVPEHWLPLIPVALDPARGSVALELGAMLRASGGGGAPAPVRPVGRILNPTSLQGTPYRIPEEEAARTGVRVQRVICRSRWVDGSTVLWFMRRRGPGAGEANSALRFDLALPRE